MTTQKYKYSENLVKHPNKVTLKDEQCAGHGDHWNILTDDIENDVAKWLSQSIENAVIASGLQKELDKDKISTLLLSGNELCHINQVLAMQEGKPQSFINAYPCVNGPYGLTCKIEKMIVNDNNFDAVLRLVSEDGSVIYAYDQLYAVNHSQYRQNESYFVNFSAWAYSVELSDEDEVILVEDPEAIRYHRAYNEIVADNNGVAPDNLEELISKWQPKTDDPLAPIEINLGHMCAYLFGETLGQEDEAWCQGQVLGKQHITFYNNDITVFDVAILREPDSTPFVVRFATVSNDITSSINVNDYIQANIWLQAAIYFENQDK